MSKKIKEKKWNEINAILNGQVIKITPLSFNMKDELLRRDAQDIRLDNSLPKPSLN